MPPSKNRTRDEITEKSMNVFWRRGFASTSVDDLVREAGTTRHSLYQEFGGKDRLFEQCLIAYNALIVTPAFARVETGAGGIADIAQYFEHQIGLGEKAGLPGPGCLMANTMTEVAATPERAAQLVAAHQERLRAGFERALSQRRTRARRKVHDQALALVVFANGLWSFSRIVSDADFLRRSVGAMLHAIDNDA